MMESHGTLVFLYLMYFRKKSPSIIAAPIRLPFPQMLAPPPLVVYHHPTLSLLLFLKMDNSISAVTPITTMVTLTFP